MKNINDSYLFNKNILMRVDLNVPVVGGKITEKSRIEVVKKSRGSKGNRWITSI